MMYIYCISKYTHTSRYRIHSNSHNSYAFSSTLYNFLLLLLFSFHWFISVVVGRIIYRGIVTPLNFRIIECYSISSNHYFFSFSIFFFFIPRLVYHNVSLIPPPQFKLYRNVDEKKKPIEARRWRQNNEIKFVDYVL